MKCTQITSDQLGNFTYQFDDGAAYVVGRADAYQLGDDDGQGNGIQRSSGGSSEVVRRKPGSGSSDGGSGGQEGLSSGSQGQPEPDEGFRREQTVRDARSDAPRDVEPEAPPVRALEADRPGNVETSNVVHDLAVSAARAKRKR